LSQAIKCKSAIVPRVNNGLGQK